MWEWYLGSADGCDSFTIGNGDMYWGFIVVESGVGRSTIEVVIVGSRVGYGCEVCVVVELGLCRTTVVVVAHVLLWWATGVISSVY